MSGNRIGAWPRLGAGDSAATRPARWQAGAGGHTYHRRMPANQRPSPAAFVTLLLVAALFGGNHVAARIAFDHGVNVATAVTARSLITALVVGLIVALLRVPRTMTPRQRKAMLGIGIVVGLQSLCLYASVARLPVALALLAFNTFPIAAAGWAWLLYRAPPDRRLAWAMPVILLGLALALDVAGAASGLGAQAQWARIGTGLGFALAASALFGLVLALTAHEVAALDGRLRSAITMAIAGVIAIGVAQWQGGFSWPRDGTGWAGLAALTVLYGSAFTIVFTLLPRIGVVGNSPIMNIEPVWALVLAWAILGQAIAPMQLAGALLVVGAVMALGLKR